MCKTYRITHAKKSYFNLQGSIILKCKNSKTIIKIKSKKRKCILGQNNLSTFFNITFDIKHFCVLLHDFSRVLKLQG